MAAGVKLLIAICDPVKRLDYALTADYAARSNNGSRANETAPETAEELFSMFCVTFAPAELVEQRHRGVRQP